MYETLEEKLIQPSLWRPPSAGLHLLVAQSEQQAGQTLCENINKQHWHSTYTTSAVEAVMLASTNRYDAAFIDAFLPDMNGFGVLERINEIKPQLPVILTSKYGSIEMARRAIQAGADDFVLTPCPNLELPLIIERCLQRRWMKNRQEIDQKIALLQTHRALIDSLLGAINMRDTEIEGHSERVAGYTMLLAQVMKLSVSEMITFERGALLHDIGKIGIPDYILFKPDILNEEEWEIMRTHPVIGYEMCSKIEPLYDAASIVLSHHEKFDGTGYPYGLKGEDIPLGARLFAISDTIDAITTDRSYRKAQPLEAALEEVVKCSGTQFDPHIVEVVQKIPLETWHNFMQASSDDRNDPQAA